MPWRKTLGVAAMAMLVAAALLWLFNRSSRGAPSSRFEVLAHRGVHHTYSREGIGRDSCTASRIYPPRHAFIENTIPSVAEAFRRGADIVEIDIHPTTDGEFAVFHDWTLDCRTNARGVTREQPMRRLRSLDVGYGYTADNGRTFPMRGRGTGLMPTLAEMVRAFPGRRFQINIKSNDPREAELLDRYLRARGIGDARLEVYGGPAAIDRLSRLRPSLRTFSRERIKSCLKAYGLQGWYGHVPRACRRTVLFVPANYATWLWGWPDLFLQRMQRVDTRVYLTGPTDAERQSLVALDDALALRQVPPGWRGGIATDAIDVIAPHISRLRAAAREH